MNLKSTLQAGVLLACVLVAACATSPKKGVPMSVEEMKATLKGEWVSIAPEVRPSATKNPDGTLKAFYLTRDFRSMGDDRFELTIVNSVDAYGKVPLARIDLRGHVHWRGDHPIAAGAQKVDFVADEDYQVTPLAQPFADVLNKIASAGYVKWEVGVPQKIFGKSFAPFGLVEGRNFMEYDLMYLSGGMLFWGARHVDGRGFDTEANRPANLQIPLMRK
jgi:hypothetical protein